MFELAGSPPQKVQFSLGEQLRRAALSIPTYFTLNSLSQVSISSPVTGVKLHRFFGLSVELPARCLEPDADGKDVLAVSTDQLLRIRHSCSLRLGGASPT
jgi:hypothetical protein